ncbi:MAG: hypothetical protein IPG32_08795 [Saprospirales bacterium]|nr:hypothetical protein [Saprospirales bacterium]
MALFYDEDYTDTQENCDGEAWNVRQHLETADLTSCSSTAWRTTRPGQTH